MTIETKIAPKNSLLLVMDKDSGEIPKSMGDKIFAATPSCIAIGTLCEIDGQTLVVLTDEDVPIHQSSGMFKVYDGKLETPNKEVHLCTVHLDVLLKLPVKNVVCNIVILVNSESEPDKIFILADSTAVKITGDGI